MLSGAYSGQIRFSVPCSLQVKPRRVTRYGRPGRLIPEGSRQLAGGKRSATTGEVRGPAGLNGGIKRCPTDSRSLNTSLHQDLVVGHLQQLTSSSHCAPLRAGSR